MAIPYPVGDSLEFNQAYWKEALSARAKFDLKKKSKEILDGMMLAQGKSSSDETLYAKFTLASHSQGTRVTDSNLQPLLNAFDIDVPPIKKAWDDAYKSDGTQLLNLHIKGFKSSSINSKSPLLFEYQIDDVSSTYSNGYTRLNNFLSTLTLDGESYTYKDSTIEIKDYSRFLPAREWDSGKFAYRAWFYYNNGSYTSSNPTWNAMINNSISTYSFPDVETSFTPTELEATFFVNPLYNAVAKDVYTNDVTGEEYSVEINLIDLMSFPDAPSSILSHLIADLDLVSKSFRYTSRYSVDNATAGLESQNKNLRSATDCLTSLGSVPMNYYSEVDIVYSTTERIIYNDTIAHITKNDVVTEENVLNKYASDSSIYHIGFSTYSLSSSIMSFSDLEEIKLIWANRIYIQNAINYPLEFITAIGDSDITIGYSINWLYSLINKFLSAILVVISEFLTEFTKYFSLNLAVVAGALTIASAGTASFSWLISTGFLTGGIVFGELAKSFASIYEDMSDTDYLLNDMEIAFLSIQILSGLYAIYNNISSAIADTLSESLVDSTLVQISDSLSDSISESTTELIIAGIKDSVAEELASSGLDEISKETFQKIVSYEIGKALSESSIKSFFAPTLTSAIINGVLSITSMGLNVATVLDTQEGRDLQRKIDKEEAIVIDIPEPTMLQPPEQETISSRQAVVLSSFDQVSKVDDKYDFNSLYDFNAIFRYT